MSSVIEFAARTLRRRIKAGEVVVSGGSGGITAWTPTTDATVAGKIAITGAASPFTTTCTGLAAIINALANVAEL